MWVIYVYVYSLFIDVYVYSCMYIWICICIHIHTLSSIHTDYIMIYIFKCFRNACSFHDSARFQGHVNGTVRVAQPAPPPFDSCAALRVSRLRHYPSAKGRMHPHVPLSPRPFFTRSSLACAPCSA